MKNQIDDKEFERIRWKCLMRSEPFLNYWKEFKAEFDNIQQNFMSNKCATAADIEDKLNKAPLLINDFVKRLRDRFGNIAFAAGRYTDYLISHTPPDIFHAPEDQSFDEVWETCFTGNKKLKYRYPYEIPSANLKLTPILPPPVIDFGERTLFCIDMITKVFREINNREPNIGELKEYLRQWMEEIYSSPCTFLMVTQIERTPTETDAILKEISVILKKKEQPKKTRHSLSQYKRYLEVYDLSKAGKTWQEIASSGAYSKEANLAMENIRSYISKDRQKAEALIDKAERDML